MYVRTAVRVVEHLQVLAAKHAREAAQGGPDYFGEEHLLQDLHGHLLRAGCEEDWALQTVEKLALCNYHLRPEPHAKDLRAALAPAPKNEPPTPGAQGSTASGEDNDPTEDEDDEGEPMETDALDSEEVRKAAGCILPPPAPPSGFVVSVTKRGKFRRLHLVEACPFIPGVHYLNYEEWGEKMPGEEELQAVCARCLPQGRLAVPLADPDIVSESSSSSGDEGTDGVSSGDEQPAKRQSLGGSGPEDSGPGAA